MARVLFLTALLTLSGCIANAATVGVAPHESDPSGYAKVSFLDEVDRAFAGRLFSEHLNGRKSMVPEIWQIYFVLVIAWMIVRELPGPRRYAALAARARSWMRWIMARNPFDLCADRWSFRPRRASSAGASTRKTSETESPL